MFLDRFSDRIGVTQPRTLLQLDDMSAELRTSLWNVIYSCFQVPSGAPWHWLARWSAVNIMKFPADEIPMNTGSQVEWIKRFFMGLSWYEAYNYIEALAENIHGFGIDQTPERFQRYLNHVLEQESSGYRFLAGSLSPISTPAEVAEIEIAATATARAGLVGAHQHITTALALLSKKPDPDYRNSIKESISALESVAKVLGNDKARGLSDALAELNKKTPIHASLSKAFGNLYGFASDEKGVRHANLLEDSSVGFDEAKFMAVACSSSVNYLLSKAQAADLLSDTQ